MLPFTRARARQAAPSTPLTRGIAALLTAGLAAGLLTVAAATPAAAASNSYTGGAFTVGDSGPSNPSPVTVTVPAGLGPLRSLTLTLLSPQHLNPTDMVFDLRSPSGVQVRIGCNDNRTAFSDSATCAPLTPFYGTVPTGTWSLFPVDMIAAGDDPNTRYGGYTLTLTTDDVAPVGTVDPEDVTAVEGAPASFTATASASPAARIQWQVSTDGSNYTDVTGANDPTYTIAATSRAQHLNLYRAVFTNGAGTATSAPALLEVHYAPEVTTEPTDVVVSSNGDATFSAAAAGVPTPTAQWQVSTDGGATFANIPGAIAPTLTLDGLAFADSGNRYRAVFTNSVASTPTRAALLTVDPALPVITTDVSDLDVLAGAEVTFTAAAAGDPTPTVQWWVSTDNGTTFTDIVGAVADSYTFTATAADDGNQYRAVYTNAAGWESTSAATLAVHVAPVITAAPTDQSVIVGTRTTFTSGATGQPAPSPQWQVSTDGGLTFTDIAGATGTTFEVLAAESATGNRYRVVYLNAGGQAVSAASTLTVLPAPVVTGPAPVVTGPAAVAVTGANSGSLALAALLIIAAGVGAAVIGRRRRTTA